ncbi:MAG: Ig-like domain-containing protein [Clostridia bacterium]|nr:Ig-like domain-containing protein [Clostridia bacterium]
MKKCRKILLILAAAVFAFALFALTACGGEEGGDEDAVKVTLDKTSVTLKAGESATLNATVTGSEETVEWTITLGDGSVIAITPNGNACSIAAIAEGNAKVKAAVGEASVECNVKVNPADSGHEDEVSISLDKTSLTMKEGDTATLTATVRGSDEAVKWELLNPDDLTVIKFDTTDGNVCAITAVAKGGAKITASIGDKTASCIVTVTEKDSEQGGGEQGGGDEDLPKITTWEKIDQDIYNGENVGGVDYIWHHIYFNDVDAKEYDFDSYEVTVKLDGVAGEVVASLPFDGAAANHAYHMHIRIQGNKYQTTVFTIQFKKDGETVAVGTYTREGDKELILSDETKSISLDDTQPTKISIISVNGKTEFTGLNVSWTIDDTAVATITENEDGTVSVTAKAVGTATLTCTIGGGFSATCEITVVEGEVQEVPPEDVTDKLHQQEEYGEWNVNVRFDCDADLGGKITSVEVTATMDGEPTNVTVYELYGGGPKYLKMGVTQDWTHAYVFTINYKNAAGKVIATGTFIKEPARSLTLSSTTLNLTLVANETVTETLTATTSGKVEGNIEWSIDDNSIATITENEDGTVTVTAIKKGTAIITATVDGLTQTCTVNVLEEGDEIPVITITDFEKFEGPYGDGRYYKFLFKATDANASKYADIKASFDHTDVDGATTDHREFYIGGGEGCYIVTVHFSSAVESGTTYKIDLCNAGGDILATFSWTAA